MESPGVSWSVDIGSIPPPAPVWDTGYREEDEWRDRHKQINSTGLQLYNCDKCGKTFKHKKSLKKHFLAKPNCEITLENIPETFFGDFEQLSKVMCKTEKRNIEENQGLQLHETTFDDFEHLSLCKICHIPLTTPDKKQIHMEEYSRMFQCCKCKKILGNRQKLTSHFRTHTKEKPFHCIFCEKIFAECSSLRKHLLTHGPKKYKCDSCNKRFIRKDYLYKHIRSGVCLK